MNFSSSTFTIGHNRLYTYGGGRLANSDKEASVKEKGTSAKHKGLHSNVLNSDRDDDHDGEERKCKCCSSDLCRLEGSQLGDVERISVDKWHRP